MKILLDECLNWRLKSEFEGHSASTVKDMGWSGLVNGQLLSRAVESGFQVFITIDKNIRFQQNLKNYKLSFVILQARLNRLEYLRPLIPAVLKKLDLMKPGEIYEIS